VTHDGPAEAVGFVLLNRHWVGERSFARLGRCLQRSKDRERSPKVSATRRDRPFEDERMAAIAELLRHHPEIHFA
jgi:hypothetical protein